MFAPRIKFTLFFNGGFISSTEGEEGGVKGIWSNSGKKLSEAKYRVILWRGGGGKKREKKREEDVK